MSKKQEPKLTRVRVRSNHGTVRITAGFWFRPTEQDVDVTDAQLEELLADPILRVEALDGSAPKPRNVVDAVSLDASQPAAEQAMPMTPFEPAPLGPNGFVTTVDGDDVDEDEAARIARIRALPSQEERARAIAG